MKEKIWKAIILTLAAVAFFGLPFSMLAFGSDYKTRQSGMYPERTMVELQDDFIYGTTSSGSAGGLGWLFSGGTTVVTGESGRPGLYQLATGATSGTLQRFHSNNSAIVGDTLHTSTWLARLNTNDANTTVRYGLFNSPATNPPAHGIYIEKLDADTNWFCVTRVSGVQTRTDSGVAVTTNFTTFSHTSNSSGVQFFIDNASVCTHTTNIPSNSVQITPAVQIENSTASGKTTTLDYYGIRIFGLSR